MTANTPLVSIQEAQLDMRCAYASGATGVIASALAWLASAIVALKAGNASAVLTLLACGVFIHPVSLVLTRAVGRSARHRVDNPLGLLALESVGVLIIGCIISYALSTFQVALFFPAMLLVIGARYALFQSMYGLRIYWALAAALMLAATALVITRAPVRVGAFSGAALEGLFALAIYARTRSVQPMPS